MLVMTSLALQQHPVFTQACRAIGAQAGTVHVAGEPVQILHRRLPGLGQVALASRCAVGPGALRQALRQDTVARHIVINAERGGFGRAYLRAGFFPLLTPATHAVLPLGAVRDTRLAAAHQKWRNRLRHAQAQHLRLARRPLPDPQAGWLLQADAAQQRARGYRSYPSALILALGEQSRNAVQLFTAAQGDAIVAAMLFVLHGQGATYLTGHTNAQGKATSAHNLILWEAAGWLSAQGICQLDLGRIDTVHGPGLARFKLGAGAQAHRLGGSWLYTPALAPLARIWPTKGRPVDPDHCAAPPYADQ